MPQMAPYNWINLYLMFNMLLVYMISYTYFYNFNFIHHKTLILKKNYYNWMW